MHTIITIFNNNVVLAKDEEGTEYVFMGKGLGFSQSSGNTVNASRIEKKFLLDLVNPKSNDKYFETIKSIVDNASDYLRVELNDYIYYSLADHIDYAIERAAERIIFRSPIQWEIQKAYPNEYHAGEKARTIINETLNVNLPEEETTFLTLHIINAHNNTGDVEQVINELSIIDDVLRIIQIHSKIDIDYSSPSLERFITHLKYFLQRLKNDEQLEVVNYDFYKKAVDQWPDIYDCVVKINKLLKLKKESDVNMEESFYLMLHINRLINRKGESL